MNIKILNPLQSWIKRLNNAKLAQRTPWKIDGAVVGYLHASVATHLLSAHPNIFSLEKDSSISLAGKSLSNQQRTRMLASVGQEMQRTGLVTVLFTVIMNHNRPPTPLSLRQSVLIVFSRSLTMTTLVESASI